MDEKELTDAIKNVLNKTYDEFHLVTSDMDDIKVLFAYRMATILGQCYSKDAVTDIVVDWKDSTDDEFVERICDVCDTILANKSSDGLDSVLQAFCHIKKMQQLQTLDECDDNGNMTLPMSIKCLKSNHDDLLNALDIKGSMPTNRICISQDALSELKTLWLKDGNSDYECFVPSDIIFAKKVSILDMEILVDDNPNSLIQPMRVVISENYQELLDKYADSDEVVSIGCLIVPIAGSDKNGFVFSIGIIPGFDCICIDMEPVMYGLQHGSACEFFENFRPNEGGMLRVCTILMQYWYSVQLSMLHHVTKDLYEHKRKIKDRRKYMLGHKCEKSVRHLNMTNVQLNDICALYDEKKYNNTSENYIVGHWRTYKSGKRTFVSPYWKGDSFSDKL